jgi:hypothetical protein
MPVRKWRAGVLTVGLVLGIAASLFVGGIAAGAAWAHDPGQGTAKKRAALPLVTVYGDSLVVQARPYLALVGHNLGLSVAVNAVGGTAPCDSLPTLRHDVATERMAVVVWAFSGNSQSACMKSGSSGYLTGTAKLAKYRTDTQTAIGLAGRDGALFVLASPPANRTSGDSWDILDTMYRALVFANPTVQYADAGAAIAPDGHFMEEQTCLPFERIIPQTGCTSAASMIHVRAGDGAHFCQVPFGAPCSGYSSGALRYAINLLSAARLDIDSAAVSPIHPPSPV